MRAGTGLAAAGLLAAACACIPPAEESASACPPVRSAEAWVNLMPATSSAEPRLVVMVRLDSFERWLLERETGSTASTPLRLNLVTGGEGVPGVAGWRRMGREAPESIDILCGGKLHHRITEITSAR